MLQSCQEQHPCWSTSAERAKPKPNEARFRSHSSFRTIQSSDKLVDREEALGQSGDSAQSHETHSPRHDLRELDRLPEHSTLQGNSQPRTRSFSATHTTPRSSQGQPDIQRIEENPELVA